MLSDHGVSRPETDKKPIELLFDLYKKKNPQTKERKATLDQGKRETQPVKQFQTIVSLQAQNPLTDSQIPLRKSLDKIPKRFSIILSPILPWDGI